jgi:hypothetical protein
MAVSTGKERCLVDWSGHYSMDVAIHRKLRSFLDSAPGKSSRERCITTRAPFADADIDIDAASPGTDDHQIRAPADS